MSNFSNDPKPHFGDEKQPTVIREVRKTSGKTISAMAKIISANKKILENLDLEKHEYIHR